MMAFTLAAIAVSLAARAQTQELTASLAPQLATPFEIKIISTEFKYSPAGVLGAAGHAVTIILDNSGAETEHGIFVPAIGFRLKAKPGEITRQTAVFDEPGEFEFSSDLPGHREAGMKGLLIVGPGSFPDQREETNASVR
jgi:plastocyanin